MKSKIIVTLLISLLLSMLLIPVPIGANDGKSILKEMVQAPSDYSVGLMPGDYLMNWGYRYYLNIGDYPRQNWFDGRLNRLIPSIVPCEEQFPSSSFCWECLSESYVEENPGFYDPCGGTMCGFDEEGPYYCYEED